jgi:hypothetical protein
MGEYEGMVNKPYIIVVEDSIVKTVQPTTPQTCNEDFLSLVRPQALDWENYTEQQITDIINDGYFLTGNGSVCLTWIAV